MHAISDFAEFVRVRSAGPVLGVGIAVLDLVHEVEVYPAEDDEVRALAMRRVRGGNVANSLAVLSRLGHGCRWVGTLGDDPAADLVLADLAGHGIEARDAVRVPGGTTPTSSILLSRAGGSRTIVHFRDLPELSADDVFNAGVIHGLLQGLPAAEALKLAVKLAGLKCGHRGVVVGRESSPTSC